MPSTRRHLAVVALIASTLTLSGCLFSPRAAPDSPTLTAGPESSRGETPSPTFSPEPTAVGELIDCSGGEVRVSEPGTRFRVTGTCPLVTIEGADLEVILVDAIAEEVVIRGDRISVDTGDIDALSISGQDNVADAVGLGALEIRGDRNQVEVGGGLGALAISGNDNHVTADSVGAVTVEGSGNQVGPR